MREVKKLATLMGADAAAELIGSGDWEDYGFALAQPDLFDEALARQGTVCMAAESVPG
jgi:hypothetical protein